MGAEAASQGRGHRWSDWTSHLRSIVGWVDIEQARYALNVSIAAILALAIAFFFNLQNTYWALLTIPLIVRQQSGTMVWRSAARLAGTLLGALVAMVLVGAFAQSGPAMIGALALWIFGTGYLARLESGTDAYAYGVGGLTAMVIALDTGPNIDAAYGYALARTTETVIAIVCGFVVLLVVFPRSVEATAMETIADGRKRVLALARAALHPSRAAAPQDRKAAIASLLAIHTQLRAQSFERSRKRWRLPRMTAVAHALTQVSVAAEACRFAIEHLPDSDRKGQVEDERIRLAEIVDGFPERREDAERTLADAKTIERFIEGVEPHRIVERAHREESGTFSSLEVAALFRLRIFASALRDLLTREAALLDPSLPADEARPMSQRYRDHWAALQYGVRPMLTFVLAAGVWILSGWETGYVYALITGALTLLLPTIVPRKVRVKAGLNIGLGYAAGAILSLALMAMLPFLDGFWGLALLLGSAIFVIYYVVGGQPTLPIAIGATLMLAIGLQPSNDQSYSAIRLINTVATLALMPPTFIAAVAILFPENQAWLCRHLRRGTDKLLDGATRPKAMDQQAFFEQAVDIIGDYGNDLDTSGAKAEHLLDRAEATLLAGLEAYELRRLAADPALPQEIAAFCPRLLSAIRTAAGLSKGTQEKPEECFAALRGAIERAGTGAGDGPDEARRLALLRFGAVGELLAVIVETGRLARTAAREPAVAKPAGRT